MADPGCDFEGSDDSERCGKTPTHPLVIEMPQPGFFGELGEVDVYYCDEHLGTMRKRLGLTMPGDGGRTEPV